MGLKMTSYNKGCDMLVKYKHRQELITDDECRYVNTRSELSINVSYEP